MNKLSYDLHIHSCLSPCGDDNMTPANIARMAYLKKLDIAALTDHNSCKNCEAFIHYCNQYKILAIPGMEITTIEEVHVLCLFETLGDALKFQTHIDSKLITIPNNERIFGNQLIYDKQDSISGKEPYLLINAVNISFFRLYDILQDYHGIMIPAHIDRKANSLITNLGIIGDENKFRVVEIKNRANEKTLKIKHPYLKRCRVIYNSDAHRLENIHESENYLNIEERAVKSVIENLAKS